MDDLELARRAAEFKNGDRESFRIIVTGMTRRLIAIAYRYVGDWETARDITQETWIKVYEEIVLIGVMPGPVEAYATVEVDG